MYRTVAQLDSLIGFLSRLLPQLVIQVQLPEPSVQGHPIYALRIRAGRGNDRRAVLLVGGTHARELMNPDAIIELAFDLAVSYQLDNDIVYGGRTWPAAEIRTILETFDVWLVPCSNPDGREYVMTVDDMWRKNRRDNPGTPCDGVDLNRNLDLLWGVTQGQTSCNPCSDTYVGSSASSEPETRNVKYLLDTYRIDTFADVHSFSELILYPWGHAPTQTTDPSKTFTTLPSGTCAPIGQPDYEEYMRPRDLVRFRRIGRVIADEIAAVRGSDYTSQPSYDVYGTGTTGTHNAYAYGRHIANPSLRKIYAYTFETGPPAENLPDSYHPADPTLIKRDAKSGMVALMQQRVCAIELIGLRLLERATELSALRRLRDELLETTEAGREWIALFELVQGRLVGIALADERLSREAAYLLEVAGRLAADERSRVAEEDVGRALSLIRELAERSESREIRAALNVAGAELAQMPGLTTAEAVARLMQRGPRGGGPTQQE